MKPEEPELRIDVGLDADADATELDTETGRLRDELLNLDVGSVERPSAGPPPPGARAVEAAILGTLLVGLGREGIAAVVRTIESWVSRRPNCTVRVELGGDSIVLEGASSEDQRRLLEAFLSRHGAEKT